MLSSTRKAIASALAGAVSWATAVTVSESSRITASEWVTLGGIAVTAFLVWLVPNEVKP